MSIPITIISGFLGAGKTTFLQHILNHHTNLNRILIIENDFGQINFDTQILGATGVTIRELTSGCICCNLQGDFKTALLQTLETITVDAIYIEPSGVGKLSDILYACESPEIKALAHVQASITVVDATNAPLFIRNFGEFFKDQVAHSDALFLSHQEVPEQVELTIKLLRELNQTAPIHTENWTDINLLEYITDTLHSSVCANESCHCEYTHHHSHTHHHATHDHHDTHQNHDCCHHHHDDHCEHHHHPSHNANHVFSTYSFTNISPRSEEEWYTYFESLPTTILRVKGIIPSDLGNLEVQHGLHYTNITSTMMSSIGLTIIGTNINQVELAKELCQQ